ncbi:hypothetical protein PHISP_00883 [Aspergillus sp. HF37]|nr:hypothetical protein PHISP_00883 [Aspergillus sp. HF37]
MSNDRATSPDSVPSSANHQRRGSISFTDFISKPGPGPQRGNTGNQSFITNAAANAQSSQPRRPSISTLGLSGSPTQTSSFGSRVFRRGSLSSSVGSNSGNAEEAVAEENENSPPQGAPNTPFSRRVSFGAQALRDSRRASMSNGRYPSPASSVTGPRRTSSVAGTSSAYNPTGSAPASSKKDFPQSERSDMNWRQAGEGFNWTEALRTRAERAPSTSAGSPNAPQAQASADAGQGRHHQRSASIASTEPPPREMPKRTKQNKPDFFQEKILRGDFMD